MAEVVAEGWLRKAPVNPKLGGFMQRSRERWFVLSTTAHRTAQIEYYTSDKLDNLKGSLPITGQSKATATGDANFTLETTAGTLVASAESGEERDQWLERISEVIKFASKARSVSVRLAAERAAERRAREEAAIEETVQNNAGCYLVWSEESDGTLIERWSMNVVEGALARFIPQKSVPGYKYKRHGGNSELLREIRNPKRFFKGVATFCKTSRESDGVLQIFPNKVSEPLTNDEIITNIIKLHR